MKTVNTVAEARAAIKAQRALGKTIGFVPTMGFLHVGHLSLMEAAKERTDFVVVSIFVNPTQFGPNEDLASYPRDLNRDQKMCESVGVDLIFAPSVEEMYPAGYSTYVDCEGDITAQLCGASRPTHFKGVTSVVAKLFNIVAPDVAFFGQKDAQQVAVIEKMVRDMNFNLEIVPCPIVREADGLAMSSRNTYLNEVERKEALVLSQALNLAKEKIDQGERSTSVLIEMMTEKINQSPVSTIDYVSIVDSSTLAPIETLNDDFLVALAVKIGKTRLIDNFRQRS
ncbi:MAG TPA: pantoate--beta-alanine ligase [Clostridiales bacterium UBA8960]|jgi:pantoate--beta-alanine ligase|nr:pantoate--beta-alanine ligase [Clostridiales bacterium UBA8960]